MKLIKINEDHYVIVDDSLIKEGDWYFNHFENKLFKAELESHGNHKFKKITYSTEPLEMQKMNSLGSHFAFVKIKELSLQEVEEAISGYNVEKMAEKEFGEDKFLYREEKRGFIKGFKAHQKLVKDKYTEAIEAMKEFVDRVDKGEVRSKKTYAKFNSILQSLQPTEWNVEFNEQGKLKLI